MGRIDNALDECLKYVKNYSSDTDGFFLLGSIYDTKNVIEKAEEYYHKALYLEPYHYETLVRLIIIFEQKGWVDRAEMLRKRINKITGSQ